MPSERNELIEFARAIRNIIKWLAGLLVLFFGWLQFKGVPIGEFVGSVSGDILVKIALSLYYLSWVAGTINDVDEQELVYAKAPNRGGVPWQGLALCIFVAAVFGILCFVPSAEWFSVVLAGFFGLNIGGYWYVRKMVSPIIESSEKEYVSSKDYRNAILLAIVKAYMLGPWQWFRFAYGFAAVSLVIVVSFTKLPQILYSYYSEIPPTTYVSLSVLLYVITFEGWIWVMRIRTKISKGAVDFVIENVPELKAFNDEKATSKLSTRKGRWSLRKRPGKK